MVIKKSGLAICTAASVLALSACGNGDQRLCTEANWYQTGVHHAQQGFDNRLARLESICAAIGVKPNAAEYTRGYLAGPTLPRLNL